MSDEPDDRSFPGTDAPPVRPSESDLEASRSYEAFEARAKQLHPEGPDVGGDAEPGLAEPTAATSAPDESAPPAEPRDVGVVDELRGSALGVVKGLAGLHLATTDVAARTLGGLVERAGDASGNERVAGLARSQAGLLRSAAGRYTSLARRLLDRG